MKMISALALCVANVVCMGQPGRAPTLYTMKVSVDSGNGRNIESSIRFRTDGKTVRMDVMGGGASAMGELYMLTTPDADSIVSVMASQSMVMINDAPARMLKRIADVSFDLRDQSIQTTDKGAGPKVLNIDTHHYEMQTHMVMDATISGEKCSKTTDATALMWVAPAYSALMNPFSESMNNPSLGGASIPADKLAAIKAKTPPGLIMREETSTGKVKTTMEVTEIGFDPIDPALFKIPAGYKVQDIRVMMMENEAMMKPMMIQAMRKGICG